MTDTFQPPEDGVGALVAATTAGVPLHTSPDAPEYAETGQMTDQQNHIMDWLGEGSNQLTREGKFELWKSNINANRPFYAKDNPELVGLTAYVIGAGPSLEKNVKSLLTISARGVLVCVEAALRYCLANGVVPEYCVCIDGGDKMLSMIEGCDTSKTTLVCTPSASPALIAAWQGPRFFVTTAHLGVEKKWNTFHRTRVIKAKIDLKAGDELFLDEQYEVAFGGVSSVIACGGNVSTAAHDFAYRFLKAQQIVFVGLDLSWTHDSHHYAGYEHHQNTRARTKTFPMFHKDVNGNDVMTNFSLMAFKRWHETVARNAPGSVVNATEGGILGIGEKGIHNPFVEFLTLDEAIAKYTPRRNEPGQLVAALNGNGKQHFDMSTAPVNA